MLQGTMTSKLFSVCIFILVVEAAERLCYYSFASAQRNHLMHLGYSNATSSAINATFSILSYLTPILGGWLADAIFGRYKVIIGFSTIYCVGVTLASLAALPSVDSKGMYLAAVLGLIALGSGGIKPNIANFGGDQFDTSIPEEAKQQQTFFSYFYMCINLGAGLAYGYLVTLATNGAPPTIPQEYGFFATYLVGAVSFCLAFIIFLLGSNRYVKQLPGGDSLRGLTYYIWRGAGHSLKGKIALLGWISMIVFLLLAVMAPFLGGDAKANTPYVLLAMACLACLCLVFAHMDNSHMEGIPDHPEDLLSLREAMATLDTIPTVLLANVTFSMGYNAMNGPLQSTSCQNCAVIVLFVPILENFLIPMYRRVFKREITGFQRLSMGFLCVVLAMIVASIVEIKRRNSPILLDAADSNCAPEGIKMTDMSAFIMFVPFALIGFGEVFNTPFLYYFTYEQTPPRARSISQAFNLLAMGSISNGFTTGITLALIEFYTDDLNDGRLEYLYYVSGIGCLVGIPLTWMANRKFKPKNYAEEGLAFTSNIDTLKMDAVTTVDAKPTGVQDDKKGYL